MVSPGQNLDVFKSSRHLAPGRRRRRKQTPLLFALVLWIIAPWRSGYQLGPDEGLNLMKAALVVEGFSLYSEIWSDQPPLLTYILTAVHRAAPFSVEAARAVILGFSGLLLVSLFCTVRLLKAGCALGSPSLR